eukprot:12049797-Heterocapsa_arctica.AAC.1
MPRIVVDPPRESAGRVPAAPEHPPERTAPAHRRAARTRCLASMTMTVAEDTCRAAKYAAVE